MRTTTALLVLGLSAFAAAQDRLATMPRFDRYEKLRREIGGAVFGGNLQVQWNDDGKAFTYSKDGKRWSYDPATQAAVEASPPTGERQTPGRRPPQRGRQFDTAISPDNSKKAFHRDRNLYLAQADGSGEIAITTDGNAKDRTKYGIASWVYGEELGVREAIWWSPDGSKIAYYKFDESKVQDYYLAMNVSRVQNTLDVEPYPKAGTDNPVAELHIYDVATKTSRKLDTHAPGEPFEGVGHYIYSVRWSPDGAELLYNRTNRKQNIMEFCAADPATGTSRVVIRETSDTGWTENSPGITWLEGPEKGKAKRFIWESERNGFKNLYLYDLGGTLINALTEHRFEVGGVERVDVERKELWYSARSGDHPYKMQLHRVGLDGNGDVRLTDPTLSHRATVSPNGAYVVIVSESLATPPTTRLLDRNGKEVATLATSDTTKWKELNLQPVERIVFTAADGVTECYGTLMKPSDFDPSKKYPLIVSVYGGPESGQTTERFATPNAICEMGFLVAWFDGRGTSGRGVEFKHALYRKLGVVEIDDQAAGVKELAKRPYVDGSRVGIYGTSYGGYSSVMALLRHPDVFHVGVASSSVTTWENYDTIYTERYMDTPQNNPEGYKAGNAMEYSRNLKGRLMLFYGTADNNVHPSNTYQLAQALQRAGKSFDMMAGPDIGHAAINSNRMWEYFVDGLITGHRNEATTLASLYTKRRKETRAAR